MSGQAGARGVSWRELEQHALVRPRHVALDDGRGGVVRYGELLRLVGDSAAALQAALAAAAPRESAHCATAPGGAAHDRPASPRIVGLLADNGIPWMAADLGALAAGAVLVPLPAFFSDAQLASVCARARIELVLTDDPARALAITGGRLAPHAVAGLHAVVPAPHDGDPAPPPPPRSVKITFTSGTTGDPRGVCLAAETELTVARSLRAATATDAGDVHLCVMPLAVLLENVGGVYRTLLAGGRAVLPPLACVGLAGGPGNDGAALAGALAAWSASVAILVPAALERLVEHLETAPSPPPLSRLRLLGVGGAPVPPRLLGRAAALGLPVREGYGLSEAGSVVALNTDAAHRRGSVGRPLPHARVSIAADGEILVRGALHEGYLGHEDEGDVRHDGARDGAGLAPDGARTLHTGDLGRLDADGFLWIDGRKSEVLVTTEGRNVSPAWVERVLLAQPALARAAVLGHGRAALSAVVVPAPGREHEVDAAIAAANRELPAYARIARHVAAPRPFDGALLRPDGGLRRDAIERAFAAALAPSPLACSPESR